MRTAAAAFVLVLLALPAAPASAAERRCGDLAGAVDAPQGIRAEGVSCSTARRLASRHSRNNGRNDVCSLAKRSCRLGGWRCTRSFFGNSGTRVRCTRGEARVRFFYGS